MKLRRLGWALALAACAVALVARWELAVRVHVWRLHRHPDLAPRLTREGGAPRAAVERLAFDETLEKEMRQAALAEIIATEPRDTDPRRVVELLVGARGLDRPWMFSTRFEHRGDPIVSHALEKVAVSDENEAESTQACEWLASAPRSESEAAAVALRTVVRESRWPRVRALACEIGLRAARPENVAALEQALVDPDRRVRVTAARTLVRAHENARGRDACLEALRPDVPVEVQANAATALELMDDRSCVLALARALDDLRARPLSGKERDQLAFVHAALVKLTGECDAERWVAWVEAHRGELPEQVTPPH